MKIRFDVLLLVFLLICALPAAWVWAADVGVTPGTAADFITSFPVLVVAIIVGMFYFLSWLSRMAVNIVLADLRNDIKQLSEKIEELKVSFDTRTKELYDLDRERERKLNDVYQHHEDKLSENAQALASLKATCTAHRNLCPGQRRKSVREEDDD